MESSSYAPSVDVMLAWLVELGPKAVNRTAKVMALVCALATVVFVAVLLVLLARQPLPLGECW